MKKHLLVVGIIFLLIGVGFQSAFANDVSLLDECLISNWDEQAKLIASDGDSYDYFGVSVSIDGDYAIIGAYGDEGNRVSGSAYVFKRNNSSWEEEAKLTASSGTQFGTSVSIDGDYAIVGTWGDNVAYIFKRDGTNWTQQAKLTGLDGNFGRSVSIDGDYVIIGSHGEDNFTGAAYIFKRDGTNWTQQAKLTASDGTEIDCFGISVSIDENYAIVGAYVAGSAYIFKRDDTNWTQQAKLTGMENSFGHDVSIDGNYALVGEDIGNNWKGAAYVFKRNGTYWNKDAKLTASDGGDKFGESVSISGEYVIVGDAFDGPPGSAYIFKCNGTDWVEEAKVVPSDGGDGSFGTSVSIDGEYTIVGADFDNVNGKWSGSAYIFKKNQPPSPPTITGPTSGKPGVDYNYTFVTTDPDGDDVWYHICWGDKEIIYIYGPYPSGEEITLSYNWTDKGTYLITCWARDIYDAESNTTTLEVTIPRDKAVTSNMLLLRILERFLLLREVVLRLIPR
jgi:hypothetical protein